ncbi:MAG TPA: AmmeMemoRadiSam system radical SAM enzyme [Spirochaetota bacterium]|jgi:pyruvate formate lyase activating enzyme|nr:AmmeMemoRadiSam system radical SAM enzyme [Spirochaetota bacterium]
MAYKEAQYFLQKDDYVQCLLCPHRCHINSGKKGLCGVRENKDGVLYSTIYGEVSSMAMDPIEKKPLYHFYPGTEIFSIGTKGCNLRCPFCQNWSISQDLSARTYYKAPEEIVSMAITADSIGIAYTYSEPTIWFEFVKDCSKLAREKKLKNVLVTNGFINPDPLVEMTEFIDAMNIDLKCFNEKTYKNVLKGDLEPVKESIKIAYEKGCFLEITTLIVTGLNDNMGELMAIAEFIASIDKRIPWHISRYYPSYKYDKSATDVNFITEVWESGLKVLDYVFTGNVHPFYSRSDTVCPSCHGVVITRKGYHTVIKELEEGRCALCGYDLGIIT